MPLISVITPVYNGDKTIRAAIQSVLNQTFSDFELIVINDGSTDSTLEVATSIKDQRLRVFSCPRAGVAVSRNMGIAKASGEYVTFLDADDMWTSDKLEAQLKALQDNPGAAVAYSWTDYIDEAGKFLRHGVHVSAAGYVFPKLLLNNFIENGSNVLIRKDVLREVGLFDESLPAAQDWDLLLRLAYKYNFVAVPVSQILYRVSSRSISTNVFIVEKGYLLATSRAFEKAPESLRRLKKQSNANIYRHLVWRALELPLTPAKIFTAFKFLWKAVINDSSPLQQSLSICMFLFRIIVDILPPKYANLMMRDIATLKFMHKYYNQDEWV